MIAATLPAMPVSSPVPLAADQAPAGGAAPFDALLAALALPAAVALPAAAGLPAPPAAAPLPVPSAGVAAADGEADPVPETGEDEPTDPAATADAPAPAPDATMIAPPVIAAAMAVAPPVDAGAPARGGAIGVAAPVIAGTAPTRADGTAIGADTARSNDRPDRPAASAGPSALTPVVIAPAERPAATPRGRLARDRFADATALTPGPAASFPVVAADGVAGMPPVVAVATAGTATVNAGAMIRPAPRGRSGDGSAPDLADRAARAVPSVPVATGAVAEQAIPPIDGQEGLAIGRFATTMPVRAALAPPATPAAAMSVSGPIPGEREAVPARFVLANVVAPVVPVAVAEVAPDTAPPAARGVGLDVAGESAPMPVRAEPSSGASPSVGAERITDDRRSPIVPSDDMGPASAPDARQAMATVSIAPVAASPASVTVSIAPVVALAAPVSIAPVAVSAPPVSIAPVAVAAATAPVGVVATASAAETAVAAARDLAAIFPLTVAAPLTVAFVRPPVTAGAALSAQPRAPYPATVVKRGETIERTVADTMPAGSAGVADASASIAAFAPPPAQAARQPGDAVAPAAAPAEVSVQHHIDVAHDGAWLDRLARDIAGSADQEQRMRFQLNPERLGALHVEIAKTGDAATVRFTVDSEAARALIADAQPRLIAEARTHGMTIAETKVDVSAHGDAGGNGQSGGGANAFAQQQQQQQAGGQRPPLFERPAAAMTRPATAGLADPAATRAERYA